MSKLDALLQVRVTMVGSGLSERFAHALYNGQAGNLQPVRPIVEAKPASRRHTASGQRT